MNKEEFLLKAFNQEHPASMDEFISYIQNIFGESLILELHKRMCNKYGLPEIGTKRAAYISKSVVFKIPVDLDGFRENDWEGSVCGLNVGTKYEIPIAKSRLVFSDDIPIVVMEKVEPLFLSEIKERFGKIPEFVSWVDMGQVGLNKKGNLVAYDYADL